MYREKCNIERLRQPELKHYVEVEKPDLACLHNVSNKKMLLIYKQEEH